jgi:glycosyltransferase involved in cell wall biosynthesis
MQSSPDPQPSGSPATDIEASSALPLVSILLLCYNQEKYVGEAVDGVLGQTRSSLEILIFDDCSADNTAKIIEARLAKRQTQHCVRFIKNPRNLGATDTLKLALEMAQGEFLVISCGDDVMLPDMVEKMAKVWMAEGVSLVTTNAIYIDSNSNPINRTFRDPDGSADDTFETLARDGSNACCFGPAIGFEPEIYWTFGWVKPPIEGYDIMIPFYAYLLKGAKFINEPLIKYRVHNENTSLSLLAERSEANAKFLVQERIYLNHLANAVLMEEELIRLCTEAPEQYAAVGTRIFPLLTIQMAETAKKLIRARRARIAAQA